MNKTTLQSILLAYLLWRVILFLWALLAPMFLPYMPSFPFADIFLIPTHLPAWLYSWANFDGIYYIMIANGGYVGTGLVQAFFPFYPLMLLWPLTHATGITPVVWGLLLSNAATVVAAISLFYLSQQRSFFAPLMIGKAASRLAMNVRRQTSWWTLAWYASVPTSFFFGALYTESIFLLLILWAFWAAHTRRWWLAGLLTMCGAATRVVGVFLIPALVLEAAQQVGWLPMHPRWWIPTLRFPQLLAAQRKQLITSLSWLLLGGVGIGIYMVFLWHEFHDPFYFASVQSAFGAGRQKEIVLLPQVIFRAVKILLTNPINWKYWAYVQELGATLVGMMGLFVLWRRRWPFSQLFFAGAAFLLPTLTGTLSSMPRYILVCFPLFFILAAWCVQHPRWGIMLILLSTLLLILNTILFIQGYWVA